MPLTLTLFGPFEARYNDTIIPEFTVEKIIALFAYLALEPGKAHRRETLAALLWPDYPNETALRNLRQSVYRLRQILETYNPALPDALFTQTRQTLTLHPDALILDTAQFTAGSQQPPTPATLTQLATLYRGELLTGLSLPDAYAFDEWLNIQREIFHQQAIESLSRLLALSENQPDTVLALAPRLLALEPWHEETHRQIMRAHLRNGNRSLALAQFQDLKTLLARELGVEPAPATLALSHQILTAAPTDEPAVESISAPLQNFPAAHTPFIGREPDLETLTRLLHDPTCRVLTLTGPGGMGKTRLGIETARRLSTRPNRFPDGMVFIPLAQIEHGGLLASTLAQTLRIPLQGRADPRLDLLASLKSRRLLLVLDNYEHLLQPSNDTSPSPAISLLVEMLNEAPGVAFLVTSRETLTLQAESVFPVEALPFPRDPVPEDSARAEVANTEAPLAFPAAQLFIQTARRHRPSFNPPAFTQDILTICRLTNGLPLALEMAAAWMRVYDCTEIVQQLTQSLDFLTNPYRDAPPRQRSIRAVFAASWEQLTAEQRRTLAALSVFRGGFTVQAALAVAQTSVLDLAALVEKSFLHRAGEARYEIHELLRQFAAENLQNPDIIHARHAAFYLSHLATQTPGLNGPTPQETLATLRRDLDNLRQSWQWAVSRAEVKLIAQGMDGLTQLTMLNGTNLEGETALAQALTALTTATPDHLAVRSLLSSYLAWIRIGLGKNQVAAENIQAALALSEQAQDATSRAYALSIDGWLAQTQGRFSDAESALREAITLFEQTNNPLQRSLALIRLGSIDWRRGDFENALAYYLQSLALEQSLNNKRGLTRAYGGIGLAYFNLGKFDDALAYLGQALQLDRELGNQPGVSRHLGNMGTTYMQQGNYPEALACFHEARTMAQKAQNKNVLAIWLGNIALILLAQQEYPEALLYFDNAIQMQKETGDRFNLCETLLGKAEVFLIQDRDASPLIEEGRHLSDDIQRKDTQLRARLLFARHIGKTAPADARPHLESLFDAYPDPESHARIFYELWRLENRSEDAYQALTLYQTCLARVPRIEYLTRIAEIQSTL